MNFIENFQNFRFYCIDELLMNDLEADLFINNFSIVSLNKLDLLQKKDDCANDFYFVLKGVLRIYRSEESEELTLSLVKSQQFVSSPDAIMDKGLTEYNIQALEETIVFSADKKKLCDYFLMNLSTQATAFKILQKIHFQQIQDNEMLKRLNANQRYKNFLERFDHCRNIPINVTSSYLGIHSNSLSRLRYQLKKNSCTNEK